MTFAKKEPRHKTQDPSKHMDGNFSNCKRNWHWKTLFLLSWRGKHFPKLCSSTGNRNICSLIHILNPICQVQFKWSKHLSQQQQEKECGELRFVSTLGEWLHRSLIFSSQSYPSCVWVFLINTGGKKSREARLVRKKSLLLLLFIIIRQKWGKNAVTW